VLEAGFAFSAREVTEHDRVAGLYLRDRATDRFDDARTFVAEDAGEGDGEVLVATDEVRVTDPDTHDTHDEFVASRGFELEILDEKFSGLLAYDGASNLHHCLLVFFRTRRVPIDPLLDASTERRPQRVSPSPS